jgi:hypothetical protein
VSWHVAVAIAGGTVTTPRLRLSSMARVWLEEAVLEVPGVEGVH